MGIKKTITSIPFHPNAIPNGIAVMTRVPKMLFILHPIVYLHKYILHPFFCFFQDQFENLYQKIVLKFSDTAFIFSAEN